MASNKVELVTGGTRGIGKAIATKLTQNGYDLVLNFLRGRSNTEEAKAHLEQFGVRVHLVKANIGDTANVKQLSQDIEATCGRLDVFINNAASWVLCPLMEIEKSHWDWTQNINAKAYFFAAQEAARLMERTGGGYIVAISSLGSIRVLPNYVAVGVSKASLEAFPEL